MIEITVTAGGFSTLILEGIKWVVRKLILKNMAYDFPVWVYSLAIPTLNILVIPVLALVGFTGYTMPTDWLGWVRSIVQVLIASAISLVTYSAGVKPFIAYARARKQG